MTLFAYMSEFYGFQGLMILAESITLVVAIINYRRQRTLRIFAYYFAFSLLQMLADCFATMNPKLPVLRGIGIGVTNLFMLFEFSVCTGRDMQDGYTLNYILYITLCFFLIRAYRCPPVNPPAHVRAI